MKVEADPGPLVRLQEAALDLARRLQLVGQLVPLGPGEREERLALATQAVQVAELWVRVGGEPHPAYLAAGDACRVAGKYSTAVKYYELVISTPPKPKREDAVNRYRQRARESTEAIRLMQMADEATQYGDIAEALKKLLEQARSSECNHAEVRRIVEDCGRVLVSGDDF